METLAQYPTSHEFRTAVVWFRRDLRVDDNPALVAALAASTNVIPVFIWAPEEEGQFQPGRCSRWWTKHSLVDLQQALAALGSRLIIRRSTDSTASLLQIVSEVGAEAVFFNHLYDPISLMRDHDCKRGLTAAGVAHRTFNGDMLYEPWEVLDGNKQPYSTFDDYWNSVRNMPVPPPFPVSAPESMSPVPPYVTSLTTAEVDWFFTAEQEASSDQLKFKWKPGVGGAITELERFVGERLHVFEHDRAKVDRDSTSRLSPWIHIGSISVRYIFYRVRQCQAEWLAAGVDRTRSCDDFLQQVGYREYSRYLAFHFPFIHERSLLRHLRACPWRIDQHAFKAWRQGQTGYPIIDAAMRQLWSSGWCHNRARVVAASFLVKDLLLPWQWGLKHYWDAQIDADLECDALGWQYVSGGMSDAHPFSYMMDLESEARRFDPDGEYVRRWLPVLSRLPTEFVHAPWKAPPQVLAAADVELGCNYPSPIISRGDAKANVDYACSVLDKCVVAQSSESSGRYPYRAPTYPVAPAGAAGAGASSGANPTGTAAAGGAGAGSGPLSSSQHDREHQYGRHHHPHAHVQQLQQQGYGGAGGRGVSAEEETGRTGGQQVSGTAAGHQQPRSHSVSAAHGGIGGGAISSVAATGIGGRFFPSSGQPSAAAAAPAVPVDMAPPPAPSQQQPVSRYGATASGAGGSAVVAAAAAPPAPMPPGGAVYYHPGDSAGQQLLEQILQQQRRARGAGRQPDGSGTNNPPHHYQQLQQQQAGVQAAPFGAGVDAAACGGAGDGGPGAGAAAAWAGRVAAGEGDEEAVALWQQQQMLQGGTAAFAFQQAMQMLLARRRMYDGVSAVTGGDRVGAGGAGEELVLEDADSEEVVSNTVDLNVTAFTGASCHKGQAGTARGARRRGREAAAAASAGMGRPQSHHKGADDGRRAEEQQGEDDDDGGSPGESSPHRSAGDEADPFTAQPLQRAGGSPGADAGGHDLKGARRGHRSTHRSGGGGVEEQDEGAGAETKAGAGGDDEMMVCDGDGTPGTGMGAAAEGDGEEGGTTEDVDADEGGGAEGSGGSPAARTPQGGVAGDVWDGDSGSEGCGGATAPAGGRNAAAGVAVAAAGRDACDRMVDSEDEEYDAGPFGRRHQRHSLRDIADESAGGGDCCADADMAASPRRVTQQCTQHQQHMPAADGREGEAAEAQTFEGHQLGVHKRRRSGSGSFDWE